ncbi:MAG: prepilin peptidase [Candidatus Thermoplasmatota archaeon]|nr:prepilin peptidase [Candidatus Thermoplasmatota archaeon]
MIETATLLDVVRFIVGVIILSYASYTDIKTRRASDILWIIMSVIGAILLLIQYLTIGFENIMILIFIPIMIGFVYLLFQMRLLFGGADAKAIMAITILLPLQPTIYHFPIWEGSFMPASWTVFVNSLIIFLFIPIFLLIYNLTQRNIKLPHALLGYKMKLQKAKEKFVWPLEKIQDGKTKLIIRPKEFDTKEEYNEFEKQGITEIWVTPKIPFMIPLLLGFICTFIFGDILYTIMSLFI